MVLFLPRIAMLDIGLAAQLTGIVYDSDATAVFLGQNSSGVAIDCIHIGIIFRWPLCQCAARSTGRVWQKLLRDIRDSPLAAMACGPVAVNSQNSLRTSPATTTSQQGQWRPTALR